METEIANVSNEEDKNDLGRNFGNITKKKRRGGIFKFRILNLDVRHKSRWELSVSSLEHGFPADINIHVPSF